MKRWKWLVATAVPVALLVVAFALWSDCLLNSLAAQGNIRLLRLVVQVGGSVNGACHGTYPLITAVKSHHQDVVEYLLSAKANTDVRDEQLATPLMRAAEENQMEMVQRLLAAKADINSFDDVGRTALRYAIRSGNYALTAVLLKSGANPNAPDIQGNTPLMQATQANNVEMVRLLLQSGADPMLQDKVGRAAFDFFGRTSDPALIPLLRSVYFVPIVEAPMEEITDLVQHYKEKFGIEIHVLPAIMPRSTDIDTARRQLIAEEALDSMARSFPEYGKNNSVVLIGITALDMYPSEESWQFCYGWRDSDMHRAIVSTARFGWQYPGASAEAASIAQRLRKAVTKDLGVMYFWKPLNHDPKSVLYDGVMGIDDLDQTSEDF